MADRDAAGSFAWERIVESAEQFARGPFMKKSQKTPQREIDLPLKRKKGTRT